MSLYKTKRFKNLSFLLNYMKESPLATVQKLLVTFKPTEIVQISVGDLSAPVETGVELSKLMLIEKNLLVDLLAHTDRDKESGKLIIHPDALGWARELRMLLKDIHDLTRGVQEKVLLKKMDVVGELYKSVIKNNKPEDIIRTIKELQNGN